MAAMQEVTVLRFSDGTEFCYTVNNVSHRVPLLRRDGFFASPQSKGEQLEICQLGVRIANLRDSTREDTPEDEKTEEMGVIVNETCTIRDGIFEVVFSKPDTNFGYFRDHFLLPTIDRLKKLATASDH